MKKIIITSIIGSVLILGIWFTGKAVAETIYVSSAQMSTEMCTSSSWCGWSETVPNPTYPRHYRLNAHIRVWGMSPNPLKVDENNGCYQCRHSGTVLAWSGYVASYTVTQHLARLTLSHPQYQDYTSAGSGSAYSNHSCWLGNC